MDSLTLKYHGLPGAGINGLPGAKGEPGNRVYFGHINRFFKLEYIDLSPYVKLGIRNMDVSVSYKNSVISYIDVVKDVILSELKKITDNSIYDNDSSDLLKETTHRFYTGGIVNGSSEDKGITYTTYWVDIDNNIGLVQSMFDKSISYNIDKDFEVKDMASFIMPTIATKMHTYTAIFLHTGDVGDLIKKLGDAENAAIGAENLFSYTGYEIYDASNKVGGLQYTCLDASLEELATNGNNSYQYIKETFSTTDGTPYMLDTSPTSGIINMPNGKYAGIQYIKLLPSGPMHLVDMFNNNDTSLSTKSALKIAKSKLSTDILFSDEKNEFYGLSNSSLYDATGAFRGVDAIWNDVSSLNPFKDHEEETRTYLHTYCITPSSVSPKYIRWTDASVNTIIPTYLDTDRYKAGDTIYFYLAESETKHNIEILFCITLTEEMLSSPMNTENFINSAQIVNPFKVQYMTYDEQRLRSYYPCNVFLNSEMVYSDASLYTIDSIEGIINSFTDNAFLLTNDKYDSSKATYLHLKAFDNVGSVDSSASMIFNTSLASANSSTSFVVDVSTLRLSSFYVDKNTIHEHLEQKGHLEDSNIIKDNGFIAPIREFDAYADYYGCQLKAEDYFYDFDERCFYGYEIYDSNGLVKSHITSDETLLVKIDSSTNDFNYNILVFAATEKCGIKCYSHCTGVNYTASLGLLDVSVRGEDMSLIQNLSGNIELITSPISAEKSTGIDVSFKPKEGVTIKGVKFNNTSLNNNEWSNYWAKIKYDSGAYTMDVSNNLPNIAGYNPDTILDYMKSGSASDTAISITESYLFTMRHRGIVNPKTNRRYVRATVNYEVADVSGDFYESCDIVQPGFTDYRDVPEIKLTAHTSINDLEKYNTIDNGVKANHFRTYLDINVEDFYEKWGRYISDTDVSVRLDFTIENIVTDPEWKRQYNVPGYILRPTVKALPSDASLMSNAYADTSFKNYVKLSVKPIGANLDIDSITSFDVSVAQSPASISIDSSWYASSVDTLIDSSDYVQIAGETYVNMTSNVVKSALSEPWTITLGLYDNIKIKFTGLDFSNTKDTTYHVAIDYEIGNPVLSNLYLRFAVTDVSLSIGNASDSSVFFAYVDPSTMQTDDDKDNYLYTLTDRYNENYKFCSKPLDVMFNPISFISCPNVLETQLSNIALSKANKGGPTAQIQNTLRFYGLPFYTNNRIINTNNSYDARINRYWRWNAMLLKSKYFLDNIGSISVKPIDPKAFLSKFGNYLPLQDSSTSVIFSYDTVDALSNKQYYSLAYRANILGVQSVNNLKTFSYENKSYDANRYMQFENNSPLFINQEASIEIRDEKMLESMNIWNFEYTTYSSVNGVADNAKVFNGVTNEYANGFNYLPDKEDDGQYGYKTTVKKNLGYIAKIGQFSISDVYSLVDTKAIANRYVYSNKCDKDIDTVNEQNAPKAKGYFRTLLYDMKWEYPAYTNGKVKPYRLVSDFDFLARYDKKTNGANANPHLAACSDLNDNVFVKANDIIPSAMLYELTPRIAYNSDYDTINCLMLRCPVVGKDNDTLTDSSIYGLNTRYFNLTSYQEILPPYNI